MPSELTITQPPAPASALDDDWREPETLGEAICDSYYYTHNYAITFLEGELESWNAIADYMIEHHEGVLRAALATAGEGT